MTASRSVRGKGHIATDTPCQDRSGCVVFRNGESMAGVVADGGGSLSHSDLGANLAVQTTLNSLYALSESNAFHDFSDDHWDKYWLSLVSDIRLTIEEEAQLMGKNLGLFGTTLLAFFATKKYVAAVQVGDGFIVVSSPANAGAYQIAVKPERGEYAGETTWVTSPDFGKSLKSHVFRQSINFVCVSSDGLEKVAIRQADGEPFPGFFAALQGAAANISNPQALEDYITTVLTDERLDKKTDDDKSMVLALSTDRPAS